MNQFEVIQQKMTEKHPVTEMFLLTVISPLGTELTNGTLTVERANEILQIAELILEEHSDTHKYEVTLMHHEHDDYSIIINCTKRDFKMNDFCININLNVTMKKAITQFDDKGYALIHFCLDDDTRNFQFSYCLKGQYFVINDGMFDFFDYKIKSMIEFTKKRDNETKMVYVSNDFVFFKLLLDRNEEALSFANRNDNNSIHVINSNIPELHDSIFDSDSFIENLKDIQELWHLNHKI